MLNHWISFLLWSKQLKMFNAKCTYRCPQKFEETDKNAVEYHVAHMRMQF